MQHLLLSEMFTDKADALLARDLDAELEQQKIAHSEYQCLAVEQKFAREYRLKYREQKETDQ